ncbi:MAG: TIM barrel protein [Clostridia bacterium]|nr:TIM barrel protein [Clostridia bacterium]
MRIPGLVSITFRNKTPGEICSLMERAKLRAVEWGGDVHVPPKGGKANEVKKMSADSGIEICSYGSYFRLGDGVDAYRYALDEALSLGAPVIRIWAGRKGSALLTDEERGKIVDELLKVSEISERSGVQTTLEYHGGTLTDDRNSVKRLIKETESAVCKPEFYWQPRWDWTEEERLSALSDVSNRLSHIHVFTWRHDGSEITRLPLSEGEGMWKKVIQERTEGCYLIEFVKGDADESLLSDALTLNGWLENA